MSMYNYEYGTTPKKIEPNKVPKKVPNKKKKKAYNEQLKINEEQKKQALKLEKRRHHKNVALILAIFFILLTVSYRSSLINEKFNEIQNKKNELASIEKTNGQLEVNIESSINLSNIEQSAKEKLGMQRLENGQKVYVTLDKKDYVETSDENIESTDEKETSWFKKILNKVLKNN